MGTGKPVLKRKSGKRVREREKTGGRGKGGGQIKTHPTQRSASTCKHPGSRHPRPRRPRPTLGGHAPFLPLPVFLQPFGPAPQFRHRRVRVPGSFPRFPGRAGVSRCRAERRPSGAPAGPAPPRRPGLGRRRLPRPMESQCDYSMYFPAVPLPPRAELAGDPGRYRTLPRRNHLYLGETVRFLLVLRCRGGAGPGGGGGGAALASRGAWAELATALAALASVSAGGGPPGGGGAGDQDAEPPGGGDPGGGGLFRGCSPLLTHGPGPATSGGATTVRISG